jgi:hypothetical protein
MSASVHRLVCTVYDILVIHVSAWQFRLVYSNPASPPRQCRLAIPLAPLRTPLLSFLLHSGEAGGFRTCTSLFHLPLLLFICMHESAILAA